MGKNRRDFIKTTGLLGAASLLPFGNVLAGTSKADKAAACTLIPSETAGPFPLDLTANTYYLRKDVRETQAGVQLNLKLRIIGTGNCAPMPNLRVNIWHCSKEGIYSGYNNGMNPGDANAKHLRGYQFTDANGEVEFITVFPGWYNGRICHIHFQVYVSSAYSAVSQLTFDIAKKNALYLANPTFYPKGADPTTLAGDNVFSDGYATQLATLTPNAATGGYDSFLEVAVQGSGTVGVGHIEKENAKQFSLGQNTPNPYKGTTTVPLNLVQPADITLDLFDLQGRKFTSIQRDNLPAGSHAIVLNMETLGLPTAPYVYQVTVKNKSGVYVDSRMMTAMK